MPRRSLLIETRPRPEDIPHGPHQPRPMGYDSLQWRIVQQQRMIANARKAARLPRRLRTGRSWRLALRLWWSMGPGPALAGIFITFISFAGTYYALMAWG